MFIYPCIIISMVCVFRTHYSQISQGCNIDKQMLFTTCILIWHESDYNVALLKSLHRIEILPFAEKNVEILEFLL